jgi:hypothetical protein
MDMSDVVQVQCQDPQPSQLTPADENGPFKCTFDGCENNEVFSTKAALKYLFHPTSNTYHTYNIPESTKTNTPVHTTAPKHHVPKHLLAIKPVSSATNGKFIAPKHPLSSVPSALVSAISVVFIGNTTSLNIRDGGMDSSRHVVAVQRSLPNEKILKSTCCLRMVKRRRRGFRVRIGMKRGMVFRI